MSDRAVERGIAAAQPRKTTGEESLAQAAPYGTVEVVLALQRTVGNAVIARMLSSNAPPLAPGPQRRFTPSQAAFPTVLSRSSDTARLQRASSAQEPGWMETASKFWGEIKESAFTAMIQKLRAAQAWGLRKLRDLAKDMPPIQRVAAEYIIWQVEISTDVLISLLLAVVGLVVGLVSGLAKLIWGLLSFVHGLFTGLILFIAGFFGQEYRDRFDEWAKGVKDAVTNIGPALRALKKRWVAEWEAANPDRKTLMIGELTGEIEAILVSIWVGGRIAPPSATVTLSAPAQAPAFAVVGGRVVAGAEGLTVTVPVAGPSVGVGLTVAMASSIDDKSKTGGSDKTKTEAADKPKTEAPEKTHEEKWEEATKARAEQEAKQAAQPSAGAVAETFDTVEAAVGQVEGKADVIQQVRTVNEGLRNQGFTETWYVVDRNGTSWTVHHNPRTGTFTGAHRSSIRTD